MPNLTGPILVPPSVHATVPWAAHRRHYNGDVFVSDDDGPAYVLSARGAVVRQHKTLVFTGQAVGPLAPDAVTVAFRAAMDSLDAACIAPWNR